ncbi:MAG: PAS domain-containing protein [Parvibaculaceae bacterium]
MNIQDIADRATTPEEILHPGSRMLFRHWETIRGEMSAPPRDWLDLRKISAMVPFVFIMEKDRRNGFVWRLAGTRLTQLWRRSLTGKRVVELGDESDRKAFTKLLDGVVEAHQPFVMRFRLLSALNHVIAAEMLGLPLRARGGGIHVLGCVMPFRDSDTLGYDRLTGFEIASARVIWTEPVPIRQQPLSAEPLFVQAQAARSFRLINGGKAN